jgi:hypothetical protein
MLHKLILSLTFAFLLGISQQGALTHQIAHLADIDSHSEHQAPGQAGDCEQCLSNSHFANSVTSHYQFTFDTLALTAQALFTEPRWHTEPHQAYTARAPPALI